MPRKILIVDDNGINRQLLVKTLQKDYDILEAENGREALELMHRNYKMLSAVLLDIVMPELDGYAVLRQVRDNVLLAQIPIIIVTGSEDEDSRVKALSLGANDFILKPFNPDIVRHCLRNNIALRETASILNAIQKDKLTGLYNREAFFEKVTNLIKDRPAGFYILSCFDIDNFKLINDQFGAVEGDRILRQVGKAVKEDMELIGGVAGRISADNFAALFPADRQESGLLQRKKARNLVLLEQQTVAFSVGRYIVTDLSLPASALYDRAYIAKQSVKGRYDKHLAYFDEEMLERLVMNQQITGEMEAALRLGQFEVWFQPQYNHASGRLIGAEALTRWRHPAKGVVSPADFIPLFEQNGFVYELDRFVWREVCACLRRWLDDGRSPLPVSVNVSRYDLFRADFVQTISELVREFDLPVELLRLEITESAFSHSTDLVVRIVRQLLDLGFTIEIDDFGSGYSSLNTLKTVPAQVVKLDMRFLDGEDQDRRGGNILESIVRMTKWLGMTVLAEGVEDRNQADFLKSIGCTYVQGYLYARPMPMAEYEAICGMAEGEPLPTSLATVSGLNYSDFWDPNSLDTMIFNHYSGCACVYEYRDGEIELLRVSDQYVHTVFGRDMSRESLMRVDWMAHVSPETAEAIKAAMEISVRENREVVGEYSFLDLPNSPHETVLRSSLRAIASAGDRHMVYCVSENVTAMRQAEAARLALEQEQAADGERLQSLLDSISGGVATYESWPEGGEAGVRLRYFNDGFCRLFGLSRAEYAALAEADPIGRVFQEDKPGLQAAVAALLREGKPLDQVFRVHTAEGGYRWLSLKAGLQALTGQYPQANAVLVDVTENQEALERLRVSEEEYRLVMQLGGNMVSRFTVADRSLLTSPEAAARFGRPERLENVPYGPVKLGLVAQESQETYVGMYEAILRGSSRGGAVFRARMGEDWRWLEAHYLTIFSTAGEPVSAVISFTDVTEQLEKEAVYQKWLQSFQGRAPETYSLYRCNISRNESFYTMEGTLLRVDANKGSQTFDGRTQEYAARRVLPEDRAQYIAFLRAETLLARFYRGQRAASLDYREQLPDGSVRWLRLSVDLLEAPNSADVEAFLLYENIDAEKRSALETQALAENDPLTGVLNRATFASRVDRALHDAPQDGRQALLMLDLDGFKLVNDVFGHGAGDQTLIDIAGAIRSTLRRGDLVGRLGGDEFVIFLDNLARGEDAATKAKRICALSQKVFNLEVQISGSVGIALAPEDGCDFETLYKRADAALYRVKNNGKNNYAFYSASREAVGEKQPAEAAGRQLGKKRRMLIVDDSRVDMELLAAMFQKEFTIEKARDGAAALISLRHYGAAISVVLLDLRMPGMSGFAVLEKLQASAELQSVPVIVVSGDEDRETGLLAIQRGATDFVTKPVDAALLRLRVQAAVSRAESARLRVRSSYQALKSDEADRYRTVLARLGVAVVEHDWVSGGFTYDPGLGALLAGTYDQRKLWQILLSDMVADVQTVQRMQQLVHVLAGDRARQEGELQVRLKTPAGTWKQFSMSVYKQVNEFGLTDKLILTFQSADPQV